MAFRCIAAPTALRSRVARVALLSTVLAAPCVEANPFHARLDNGIEATVYSAEDVMARTTRSGDRLWLEVGLGLRYELVTEVGDPIVTNKGDGSFHPMSESFVVDALRAIQLPDAGLEVEVFILPYPRREILDSSARDGMVLLSPGVRPVSEYAVHFTVTHEVGHVYQYRWMPDADTRAWQRYDVLRGIAEPGVYHAAAVHRNRPHEIFAEDFRYLFGGETANYSGSIENASLTTPDEITGLSAFMRELSDARRAERPTAWLASSPNPFNPSTEIRVHLDNRLIETQARVRVLDAQGHEVRRLYDGRPATGFLRLPWDGRDETGARVATGLYFAQLESFGTSYSTKLLMVK